jgi:hypothetical protein
MASQDGREPPIVMTADLGGEATLAQTLLQLPDSNLRRQHVGRRSALR